LDAVAPVQHETGVAATLHPTFYVNRKSSLSLVEKCLKIYSKGGGDFTKFVLSHSQGILSNKKTYLKNCQMLFELGITLCFEFGSVFYEGNRFLSSNGVPFPTELEKINAIIKLIQMGFDQQIVLSQDVYLKIMQRKYGGFGYSHVLETIVPILRNCGVTSKELNNILINNPKRILQH
jgi:predicted metal-dependent phosphotriesterase family hydrolase